MICAIRYAGEWVMVRSCTGITNTYCDLSTLIQNYGGGYKVRVQTVAGNNTSLWTMKKFLPNASKQHDVVVSYVVEAFTKFRVVNPNSSLRIFFFLQILSHLASC